MSYYAYVVEVKDDGVGFDVNGTKLGENLHFGISNIKHRLQTMCDGKLEISSEINKGTKAVITFYKG